MTDMHRLAGSLALAAAFVSISAFVTPVLAAGPTFGSLTASAPLGGPTTFTTTITADAQPLRVEALLTLPGSDAITVLAAPLSGGNGTWTATATLEGHVLPNTNIHYRFRVRDGAGVETLGPEAEVTVVDDRFNWQTKEGPVVRLHWYSGDDAFAQRALDIGERAMSRAAELLGVTDIEPVDFFIYDNRDEFYVALGPGARENVGGQAVQGIRTMFGLVRPEQINDDWVDILVTHELTHLVFNAATDNAYRPAPHWLNEGVATYLSEGLSPRFQAPLDEAVDNKTLIPLQGMSALFGAGPIRFDLGYAESVSAVIYFVDTYGEPKLWELVRSFAEALSDDEAFTRATGADLTAFNAAWMGSLGYTPPPELGPQPGPTGPLPPDWAGLPTASPGASQTAAPGASSPPAVGSTSPAPTSSSAPTTEPTPTSAPSQPADASTTAGMIAVGVVILVVAVALVAAWLLYFRNRRRPPPPPPAAGWYGQEPPAPPPPAWPPAG